MITHPKGLGLYLKKKRENRNLSQGDVAKILGCKAQFVSNIERGITSPPWKILKTMMRVYEIPETEIVDFLLVEQEKHIRIVLGIKSQKSKARA